ncbi:GNAT family N-acetyltransferase [Kocuria marina]|uniref:GNAT family N-acetyltransferase n=2 Tax=Kocuria TaxID=57493 RepID=UPI0038506F34
MWRHRRSADSPAGVQRSQCCSGLRNPESRDQSERVLSCQPSTWMTRLAPSEFGQWYVGGLGVAPIARRQGLARMLIEAALASAEARDGDSVWLKVLSSNVGAVALYPALGFTETARFANAFEGRLGVDDLRLSAQLPLACA